MDRSYKITHKLSKGVITEVIKAILLDTHSQYWYIPGYIKYLKAMNIDMPSYKFYQQIENKYKLKE